MSDMQMCEMQHRIDQLELDLALAKEKNTILLDAAEWYSDETYSNLVAKEALEKVAQLDKKDGE